MNEPVIESVYRLDAVVVTVDSVYGLQQLAENHEALKQAAVADVLLLSKIDLADAHSVTALAEKLGQINPGASLHRISHGQLDPALVIDVGLFDADNKRAQPQRWLRSPSPRPSTLGQLPQKDQHDGIISFTVTLPSPINWSQLKPHLLKFCQTYGKHLLRLKGIIHAADQPAPLAIHAVHFTPYPPTLLEGWSEPEKLSRVVIIAKDIDELRLRKAFMML